jgi:trk system potassium uptake protein TrkH
MTIQSRILKSHPSTILLASFLLVIAAGVLLLKLPVSTVSGHIAWVDALFTATSAVCVTGLAVLETGSAFTLFGQCVIIALIQVGGLGLMTISVALFRWIGGSVSFRYRMVLQDVFAHTPRSDIFGLVKSVFLFTFTVEFIGAVALTIHWRREFPLEQAAYRAIFHSVSAFCNAGFSLFPDSFMRYSGSPLLNVTICSLIVIGGIGFPVLYDLQNWLSWRKRRRVRLSVHSKTVLWTTST